MLEAISIILKVIFIVFFFGFCVFIHEFGHLVVALWQGLHVEKFSIGMGPKIWGFHWRGVEFVVSWLPFGGYVSLPQLDPTDHPETSDKKPLPFAGPRQRALTAFAGPLFNVLFGFLLAFIFWGVGLWGPAKSSAVVVDAVPAFLPVAPKGLPEDARLVKLDGEAIPEYEGRPVESLYALALYWNRLYPARPAPESMQLAYKGEDGEEKSVQFTPESNPEWIAGLRAGDRITAVNGKTFTGGVDEFNKEYVYSDTRFLSLAIVRDGQPQLLTYTPAPNPDMENLGYPFFVAGNPLQTGAVAPGSPAAQAGLTDQDQLLALDTDNIRGARHFGRLLQEHAGKSVTLTVARGGVVRQTAPLAIPADNPTEEALGISFKVLAVNVIPGYPAAEAGLRNGDQITRLEQLDERGMPCGKPAVGIIEPNAFVQAVRASEGHPVRVTYLRDGKESTAQMTPVRNEAQPNAPWQVGVIISDAPAKVISHPNPWAQFSEVMGTTCRTLGLLFRPITSRIGSLFSGKPRDLPRAQIGVKHMSGPVGILLMLWYKLRDEGYRGGFAFIILITFSLAFMNLLPLPVLDGGHILFAGIEAVTRRRMPAKLFTYVYNFFAILLIGLMIFITFFDGKRVYRITTSNPAEKKLQKNQAAPRNSEAAPANTAPATDAR